MRLFLGIFPPETVLDALDALERGLRKDLPRRGGDLRWVPRGRRHLTLVFLGERPEAEIAVLEEGLEEGLRGTGSFEIVLDRGGAFPEPSRARVLWVGPSRTETLAGLASRCREALGLEDSEEHRPHLTLARTRRGRIALPRFEVSVPPFEAGEVRLVASVLRGPDRGYRVLATFPLREGS